MKREEFDSYMEHFNARDYAGLLSFYSDSFALHFAGYVFRSRAEVEGFYRFFHAYVDEGIAIQRFVSDAQTIAIEALVRITCRKDLTEEVLAERGLSNLVSLKAGETVELPQFIHYHLVDGRFAKVVCVPAQALAG